MILGKIKANTKAKAEPSREEMLAVVSELLKKVDFDIVSSLVILLMFVSEFYSRVFSVVDINVISA